MPSPPRHLPRWDVLGLGAVAVDELLYVERYPPPDAKVRVQERIRQCGGLCGTALVAAARLGARCAYAGQLGDDSLSLEILRTFKAEGIDAGPRATQRHGPPVLSTIIVDQSRRVRNIFSFGAGEAIGPTDDWPPAEIIQSAAVLLVDHHGLTGTLRAVRIAHESGIPVVADMERDPGEPFAAILGHVDHLIVSEEFALAYTGASSPEEALARLASMDGPCATRTVVVTQGDRGGCYAAPGRENTVSRYPAVPVDPVDTTGCGDVFHGAYAASLAQGDPLRRRIETAAITAALKARHRGGQAGCPSRQEVDQHRDATGRSR